MKVFMDSEKVCTVCQESKSTSEFYRDASRSDGFTSRCKTCVKQYQHTRYHQNVEREREKARRYYREHTAQECARIRAWRKNNPEKMRANREKKREWDLRYRQRNREKLVERKRIWSQANPEKVKAIRAKRRAREKGAIGHFSAAEWLTLKERYGGECLCCGNAEPGVKLTVDHVMPLSRGGSNNITNIQPLCLPCNVSKAVKATDYRLAFK